MLQRRSALLGISSLILGACAPKTEERKRGLAALASNTALAASASATSSASQPKTRSDLLMLRDVLTPLHTRTQAPRSGEWRADHPEPGQTVEQYLSELPVRATSERRTLVVQPLGAFSEAQLNIVKLVVDYMEAYFGLPVRMNDAMLLDRLPHHARRTHPTWGDRQVLSRYLLRDVLTPKLPADAAAMLALTAADLWPGQGWNFVFGEADLRSRVGVWSIYRYGDPSKSRADFQLALRRAIAIAVHETGHMFSLEHCTAFRCVQAGVNSLEEGDRAPLYLCADCVPKLVYATGVSPKERFQKLLIMAKEWDWPEEVSMFERSITLLDAA